MPVHSDRFKQALGRFASGVTVVTTSAGDKLAGLTVSAFSSVSLSPPYILVCINKESSSIEILRERKVFVVNFLSDEQVSVSNLFASHQADKFAGVSYHVGQLGVPILDNCLAYLACSVVQEVEAGDHFIYIGQVEEAEVDESKHPLLYYHGRYETLDAVQSHRD